jgi:hypothetical protein
LWQVLTEYDLQKKQNDLNTKSLRERMRWRGQTNGKGQFYNFVNRALLHKELADIFFDTPQHQERSVAHLMHAITWVKHRDSEADYLLLHAERLDLLDRFRDAQAALIAVRRLRFFLENQTFAMTKTRQVEVLDCIMQTRLGDYTNALIAAENLWREWQDHRFNPLESSNHSENSIPQQHSLRTMSPLLYRSYRDRLAQPELIAFYDDLCDILKESSTSSTSLAISLNRFALIKSDKTKNVLYLAELYLKLSDMADQLKILNDKFSEGTNVVGTKLGADIVKAMRGKAPYLNITWNIAVRMIYFLARESLYSLEQMCQIANNITYNRVELGLDQSSTIQSVRVQAMPMNNQDAIEAATEIMSEMLRWAAADAPTHTKRFRFYLRNYYDTWGWYFYRTAYDQIISDQVVDESNFEGLLKSLADARQKLAHDALQYDHSSIVYYHLARVHLAMVERIWQAQASTKTADVKKIAPLFQEHLRLATNAWRDAVASDINHRLKSRLNWLGQRIEKYAIAWEKRFLASLDGSRDYSGS